MVLADEATPGGLGQELGAGLVRRPWGRQLPPPSPPGAERHGLSGICLSDAR